MPGPSLGTNLGALVDWSTAHPFVNLMAMSRPWYTQTDRVFDTGQAHLLDLDADGWVRGFTRDGSAAPFDRVATILNTGDVPMRAGTYILDWEGEGTVRVNGGANTRILSQEAGRIVIRTDGREAIQISITATDPRDRGEHVRDMRLYHAEDADLIAAGVTYNPAFFERIADFRVLRFMDWMATNNSTVDGWEDVRPDGWTRQADYDGARFGASLAAMVELANTARADPWFTIPHLADDDYIRRFATYVRDNLDPGLVARFEYSNEVWNFGFRQSQWAIARAEAEWGPDAVGGYMQWYGVQAANMARIVADVFGNQTGTRALNVFATQSGWQGLETYALNAPDHVADGGTAPRRAPFHVYAIAPYLGGSIGNDEMDATVDRWATQGEAGIRAALAWLRNGAGEDTLASLADTIEYHAGVARRLGWQLEAYEGGQHIVDPAALFGGTPDPERTAFFIELAAHPGMAAIYRDYFALWRESGGGLMAQFSDFGASSQYGSWGIWESAWGPDTPRSRAVEAFRDAVAAWWDDPRGAWTFANGLLRADAEGTGRLAGGQRGDTLFGLAGGDRLDGRAGGDSLYGGAGNDTLSGGSGGDSLVGGNGNDRLAGGRQDDALFGGAGTDTLLGGRNADRMWGGTGADVFLFDSRDSPPGQMDTIGDFTRGADRIDLRPVDGDLAQRGDQPLRWLGGGAFDGEGGALRVQAGAGGMTVQVDIGGDGRADLQILVRDVTFLGRGDFLL